jgi:hypothetical protein
MLTLKVENYEKLVNLFFEYTILEEIKMKVKTRQHAKHSMLLIVVNLFMCILFVLPTLGDDNWEFVSNKKGIKVEKRLVEGCPLKECRAEAIIDAPIEVIYKILTDGETWKDWYGFCLDSKNVQKIDENTFVIYLAADLPYPFHDRDGCLLVNLEKNFDEGKALFEANMIPDSEDDQYGMDSVKEEKRRIRMKSAFGTFKLTRVDPNKTKLRLHVGGDPNIFLPYWFMNFIATIQPVKTIKGLKKEVKKEIYYDKGEKLYNKKVVRH